VDENEKKLIGRERRSRNKLNQFFHEHLIFLKFSFVSLFVLVLFYARNVFES
jgi:hypothetical protein